MGILFDIRFALRLLYKSPKFLALTLVVLIGGITVSLFTFSFFHTMFYKDIPVAESHNIYRVTDNVPLYEYAAVRGQFTEFAEFGVWRSQKLRLLEGGSTQNVVGIITEWNLFEFARAKALLGRTLQPHDSESGADPVAVIGYSLWQSNYSAKDSVLGETVNVNGQLVKIVGVMPKDFLFPQSAEMWLPFTDAQLNPVSSEFTLAKLHIRLKEESDIGAASNTLQQLIMNSYISRNAQFDTLIEPRPKMFHFATYPFAVIKSDGAVEVLLVAINIASILILVLSSVNVGNLLLARVLARSKESAVRVALGAGNSRLVSQLMWEGTIIVVIGTIISLFLTSILLDSVTVFLTSAFGESGSTPFWWRWGLDGHTLAAGIAFMLLTIFVACYLPARRSAKAEVCSVLRDGTRGAQGQEAGKVSRLMIGFQLFFASLIMSFGALLYVLADLGANIEPGYKIKGLMAGDLGIPEENYDIAARSNQVAQLLRNLEASDDIDESFLWSRVGNLYATVEGNQTNESGPTVLLSTMLTTESFGAIKLIQGRYFGHQERSAGPDGTLSLLVSQSFIDKRFKKDENVLGKRVQMAVGEEPQWYVIVGVVDNLLFSFTEKPDEGDEVYVSYHQMKDTLPRIYFRANGKLNLAEGAFYESIEKVLPQVEIGTIRYIEDSLDSIGNSLAYGKKAIFFSGVFGLLLALIGVYGMTANAIVEKSHEVGLRRALGATEKDIIKLFLLQSLKPLKWGVGLGLGLASFIYWAAITLIDLSFGYFILNLAIVSLSIALIVLFAVIMPSRKAVSEEPSVALRAE